MLWLSTGLGVVYLLAAVVPSVLTRGLPWALGPRDQPAASLGKTAARLDRAWRNFLETFPLFVAAILLESAVAGASGLGGLGAQLYFWGRVAFLPIYALGLPVLRTLAWTVSLVGIALIWAACLPGV
jgi:uncharacterized MAPEG superfamily protein